MDPASATISAVSLATAVSGTFTSIVQCLEYVEQAKELLAVILDDIQTVQHKSTRYDGLPSSRQGDEQALKVFDVIDLDPMHVVVVQKAADTFKKRTKQIGWGKKTKWAVFEKKQFDSLLNNISENTSNLEKLFPASREAQMQLSTIEVEEIRQADDVDGVQTLAVLDEAVGGDTKNGDKFLEQAISEAMKQESTHVYLRTEARDDVKFDQGDFIHETFKREVPKGRRGHTYGTTIFSGRTTGRQGDTFGRKPNNEPY